MEEYMEGYISTDVPRVEQTLSLPESKLESLRPWAVDGTGVTAAVRVLDSDGRIALVRNRWTDGWFLPGGAVEPGETPREAARRELREETGLDGTLGEQLVVLDQTYVSDATDEAWFDALYVVFSGTADGEILPESELGVSDDEIEAARWFESVPRNLHDGDLLGPYLSA
jgi:8-oxo-dGTP diphosphatase